MPKYRYNEVHLAVGECVMDEKIHTILAVDTIGSYVRWVYITEEDDDRRVSSQRRSKSSVDSQ